MGFEYSIIFAFLAMLCWGFGDFFIQKNTRKVGDLESLAYIAIFGGIVLIPFIIKDAKLLISIPNLLLLLLLSIITFVAAILDFEALKKGKLSVIDMIIELELPVTIILGMIFFNEHLNTIQLLIISTIFLGIMLMAFKSFKNPIKKLEKGLYLALIAAIGMGLINFLTAASSKTVSPILAVWFPWTAVALISIFFINREKGFKKFFKDGIKYRWILLFMAIFDTLAWLFYAYATHNEEISIITAISESYPAVALFLGIIINKERIKKHQFAGALLVILACFLLAFTV